MPWVRFDDQYPIHRKVDGLSDAAFRLHTSAIFWSARNLTDGFVSREDLDGVSARVRTPERFAAECVGRGVWHDARQPCLSEKCPGLGDGDGWVIHDYWEYQPSKTQVARDREAAAKRQKKWREARNPQGYPQGDMATDLHNPHIHRNDGQSNASSNGVSNGVSAASPPRPERKRGGKAPPRASPARAVARSAGGDAGQHPFKPDPNGTCETCGLPESNRHHMEAS